MENRGTLGPVSGAASPATAPSKVQDITTTFVLLTCFIMGGHCYCVPRVAARLLRIGFKSEAASLLSAISAVLNMLTMNWPGPGRAQVDVPPRSLRQPAEFTWRIQPVSRRLAVGGRGTGRVKSLAVALAVGCGPR